MLGVAAVFEETFGERAVVADAVRGDLAGSGGERDQRAGVDVFGRRDAARLEAARRRELGGKWIVAAGVEEQQLYVRAGGAHHFVDIEHSESIECKISLVVDSRGNRQYVIVIPHLDSVAGIVEQGDVRPGNILGEAA